MGTIAVALVTVSQSSVALFSLGEKLGATGKGEEYSLVAEPRFWR